MNIFIPNEPKPGEPLKASWAGAVVRALRALLPSGGPGVIVTTTANGTTIRAVDRATALLNILYPFKISIKDATHIKIEKGTVNNKVPNDMVVGEDFLLEVASTKTICMLCTFSETDGKVDGKIEKIEFKQEYTEPTKKTYCIRLGEVTVKDGKISAVSNYLTNSLGLGACPDGNHADAWQLGALETGDITGGDE